MALDSEKITIPRKEYDALIRKEDEFAYILGAYKEYLKSQKKAMKKTDGVRDVQFLTEQILRDSAYVMLINNSLKDFLEKETAK